ncbi:MAG: hypothetical protein BWX76_00007 [Candidatus Cloacimonetes bacterium ADurb.Bin089]|nr:MAG: hypothetical protein BWX76_00007 [Candidatus Cloacimonetes bacterium ADurb.Bin089]
MNVKLLFQFRKEILNIFKTIDIRTGMIVLTEKMFNEDFRPVIMEKLSPEVNKYTIHIQDEKLLIDLIGATKGINFTAKYIVKIDEFSFEPSKHYILIYVNEEIAGYRDLKSKVVMVITRALLYGVFHKKFINLLLNNQQGMEFDHDCLEINLDQMPEIDHLKTRKFKPTNTSILDYIKLDLLEISNGRTIFKLDYKHFGDTLLNNKIR